MNFTRLALTLLRQSHRLTTLPMATTPMVKGARMMSWKVQCVRLPPPRCSPEELAKSPCAEAKRKGEEPPKTMWENPECCLNPCPDVLPRFDDLYYRVSDKRKRCYQQTWNECPEIKIVPKKICCFEKVCMPPFERRPRKVVPKTACPPDARNCPKGNHRCRKINLPCCKEARNPPHCRARRISNCKKICCPYPSFSECTKIGWPRPTKPKECECLASLNMCTAYAYYRKWGMQRRY